VKQEYQSYYDSTKFVCAYALSKEEGGREI
jgi:hypothetical protein